MFQMPNSAGIFPFMVYSCQFRYLHITQIPILFYMYLFWGRGNVYCRITSRSWLSFHHVELRDEAQIIGLGGKHFHQLSHHQSTKANLNSVLVSIKIKSR